MYTFLYIYVFTKNYMNFFWDVTTAVHDSTIKSKLLLKFRVELCARRTVLKYKI